MPSSNLSPWIPYLKEPLVLIGFVLMLLFGVIERLVTKGTLRISKKSLERLLRQCLLYAFVLAFVITIFGFMLSFNEVVQKRNIQTSPEVPHGTHTAVFSNKDSNIEQHTEGNQSPAIISNSDVNITIENTK